MAASNHRKVDPKEALAAFDTLERLPAGLRREICFAARVWDAAAIEPIYKSAERRSGEASAVLWLCASIEQADEDDVRNYAFQYRARHGVPLPHYAAGATVLRFMEPRAARCGRVTRPRLSDRGLRSAWRASDRLMPAEGLDDNAPMAMPVPVSARFAGLDIFGQEAA